MRTEKRKRQPCRGRVQREENGPTCKGIGHEFRCPECGDLFLVTSGEWGYVYKGQKYCRYNCLRAAERRNGE